MPDRCEIRVLLSEHPEGMTIRQMLDVFGPYASSAERTRAYWNIKAKLDAMHRSGELTRTEWLPPNGQVWRISR